MQSKSILLNVLLSIALLLEVSCESSSQDGPNNFKLAYIDKVDDSLVITVMGRRSIMAHDPISALKDRYYVDSVKFKIPNTKNFAGRNEVHAVGFGYPIASGGIWLMKDSLRIDLRFNDYDSHQIVSSGWNGTYLISWRHRATQ